MRIKSINITAFGGLKNKTVDFSDGFNVVYGDNENGKTTVMSFIKMMFYGSGRNSAQLSKNIRKRYTPWDGGVMAGSVDFELDGKNYRLEREFRNSDSTDKITLCDLDLGLRQPVSGDIGVKLLGLSAAAFERSVFVGQLGSVEKDAAAEGEINSKLSNIVTTGDESVSFETVNKRLEKAKLALMSKSGRAGEYDKDIKALSDLKERLKEAEKTRDSYEDFKVAAQKVKSDIEEKIKRASVLKEQINSEQDIRNADKLREMLDLKAELDRLNDSLKLSDGGLIDENYVRKLNFCISKTESVNTKLKEKATESKRLRESIELALNPDKEATPEKAAELTCEIERLEKQHGEIKTRLEIKERELNLLLDTEFKVKNTRKKLNVPMLIPAVVLLIASAVLFALKFGVFAAAAAVPAVVLAVLSFVIRPLDKKKINEFNEKLNSVKTEQADLKLNESSLVQSISSVCARLEAINAALNTSTALLERQKTLLAECESEEQTLKSELETEQSVLYELFGRYKKAQSLDEIKLSLEAVSEKAAKQKEIKQRLNYIARDVGNISYDEARDKLVKLQGKVSAGVDFDALKQEYEILIGEISDKKARLAAAADKARASLEAADNPEELKKEINALTEKTDSEEQFCRAADVAMSVLQDSFAELRRNYGSALEQKSGEIFGGLTGGRYKSVQISKAFDISVEKKDVFGGKELDYLSSGTVDQAYLSLRLALSSLMFEGSENLPILLDDALTQYDDNRAKTALEYLKKYAENGQIIMFTCHRSLYDASTDIGADCKAL